jgi:1-pyrroline-5-carboxylate dehydrogenase
MTPPGKITYTTLAADESIHGAFEQALAGVMKDLGQHHPVLIGGKEVSAREEFPVRSPIDRDILIGHFQNGGPVETDAAISAAGRAFPSWEGAGFAERARVVRATAGLLESRQYSLAALITVEVGKNRSEALAEVSEAVDMLSYYADVYDRNQGYQVPMSTDPGEGSTSWSILRPYGVWAVISPFNFPLALAAGMISAALITGNTVVFKPASEAPLTGLHLCHAFTGGGVPPGVLSYVTGPGESFGPVVTAHPDVAGIAFTGSRDAGMWLHREFPARQAYPKPLVAEMGSKNPVIITARADLDRAVEGVTRSAFGYGGQKCSATSRVYIESGIADAFLHRLKERIAQIRVGDPRDREVFFGPLINEKAHNRFREAVAGALNAGGRLVTGGEVISSGDRARGYYVTPTVVSGLPREHHLWRDELFLPFLLVDSYTTLPEALERANETDFGLTSGIFSADPGEIGYFFTHIRSGVCYANRKGGATTGAWPGKQSFVGWKASGSTGRGVGGPYYLLSFLREQAQTRYGGSDR